MFNNYFEILEIVLLFVSFPYFLKIFNSINFGNIFKKGYTSSIQIIYICTVFIFAYLFSSGLTNLLEMFYNIIN